MEFGTLDLPVWFALAIVGVPVLLPVLSGFVTGLVIHRVKYGVLVGIGFGVLSIPIYLILSLAVGAPGLVS